MLSAEEIEGKPNLPLGYEAQFLPGFATCPPALNDLRLLHGSCRKIGAGPVAEFGSDAIPWIDKLIADSRTNPTTRPHQLFLTGDQIYADDVPDQALDIMTEAAAQLIGTEEMLPIGSASFACTTTLFPPGFRQELAFNEAKFTSTAARSHLLSFGEFAAMYLMAWSNALWPDIAGLKTLEQIVAGITTLPATWKQLMPQVSGASDTLLQSFAQKVLVDLDNDELRNFANDFDEKDLTPKNLQSVPPEKRARHTKVYAFAGTLAATPASLKHFQTWVKQFRKDFGNRWVNTADQNYANHVKEITSSIKDFHDGLPKTRRVLANVPTYMLFDDHEVTDDWNLTQQWRDQVYSSQLGRAVVRNALASYAMFQAWGNNPAAWKSGTPAQVLTQIADLFPAGTTGTPAPAAVSQLDSMFGIEPVTNDPAMKWHFEVKGPQHKLLALDTRTRRVFFSRLSPPGLLTDEALEEQIPEGPLEAGIEALFVIAPGPVLNVAIIEEYGWPAATRVGDFLYSIGKKRVTGFEDKEAEAWGFHAPTLEKLLARLFDYKRVIFLSGDVHYSMSAEMDYWKLGESAPSRFVQFTSSALKNAWPPAARSVLRSFTVSQRLWLAGTPVIRLGWVSDTPAPVNVPGGSNLPPSLRARLRTTPVLVPLIPAWPPETTSARPPDWSWRLIIKSDARPDASRPAAARPLPLVADINPANAHEGYVRVAQRHLEWLRRANYLRHAIFDSNFSIVRFSGAGAAREVEQQLFSLATGSSSTPEAFTIHRSSLAPTSDPPRKLPGDP
ncbi:MAG: hypothetical protein ACKVX9_14670 [Blastocatellia bacterium]